MKVNENLIVTDTKPGNDWKFDTILSEMTELQWNVLDGGLQYKLGSIRERLKRYINFLWFPFQLFLNRKKVKHLIAWQQYYGLIYAFYCMLFHVKKQNYCMIMTFIYRQRNGILGYLQKKIMIRIVNSKYVDRILVYSSGQLVILQAMQFAKPVIVTESKAVTDYISDGQEGFIIPKDEQILREKIELLYQDKKLYNQMSAKARERYEKNFSIKSLGKQITDCFERDMREHCGKEN